MSPIDPDAPILWTGHEQAAIETVPDARKVELLRHLISLSCERVPLPIKMRFSSFSIGFSKLKTGSTCILEEISVPSHKQPFSPVLVRAVDSEARSSFNYGDRKANFYPDQPQADVRIEGVL